MKYTNCPYSTFLALQKRQYRTDAFDGRRTTVGFWSLVLGLKTPPKTLPGSVIPKERECRDPYREKPCHESNSEKSLNLNKMQLLLRRK